MKTLWDGQTVMGASTLPISSHQRVFDIKIIGEIQNGE
jgi:hypothetical protein